MSTKEASFLYYFFVHKRLLCVKIVVKTEVLMNIGDAYYKKISYKKNTYEDLKLYLKMYHSYKNVMFISTKSCPISAVTSIVNAITYADCNFKHICVQNNFDSSELSEIKSEFLKSEYHLIVGLGGGKACDICKFFADMCGISYVFSPTIPSSLAYFSKFCVNPFDASKSFYAKSPEKIFISETIIKEINKPVFDYCFANFLSYKFVVNDLVLVDSLEYSSKIDKVNKIFTRLKEELFQNEQEENNLVLMDLFIDLGYELIDFDIQNCSLINYYLLSVKMGLNDIKFMPILPVCADIYGEICCYLSKKDIGKKINVYNVLKAEKLIKKYKINQNYLINIKKLENKCQNLININNYFTRIGEIALTFKNSKSYFKSLLKKYFNQKYKQNEISIDNFLMAFYLLPTLSSTNYFLSKMLINGELDVLA